MKKLICASEIKKAKSEGIKFIVAPFSSFIITPEAYDIARSEGIDIVESAPENLGQNSSQSVGKIDNKDSIQLIQSQIQARLPENAHNEELINQLIKKALLEFEQQAPNCPRQINDDGIVLVRGNAVSLDVFDGAPGKNIGLKDVIGSEQNSNMGVGYMGWEKAFFPWKLTYDEVDVILEGELHIKTASGTTIGKPGDVIFIPKNSDIEFGTPTHVRFVYVTYPANWG